MEETIEKQTSLFNKYVSMFVDKIPEIIVAIIILVIGIAVAKISKRLLSKMLDKYKSSIGVVSFCINSVQVIIVAIAVIQALSALGVNTTSFAAVIGAAGLSIGFAFKEIISNLGASMMILFFKPFLLGDYISCNDIEGSVYSMQMVSTTLKTVDNKLIIMPNYQLVTNPVINYTNQINRRIDLAFNVEFETDLKMLYKIAQEIFDSDSRILKDPKPLIGVDSVDNNIVKFVAKPWVKTDDYWDVYYDVMEKFKHQFEENKVKLVRLNVVK